MIMGLGESDEPTSIAPISPEATISSFVVLIIILSSIKFFALLPTKLEKCVKERFLKGAKSTLWVLVDIERDFVSSVSNPHLGQGRAYRDNILIRRMKSRLPIPSKCPIRESTCLVFLILDSFSPDMLLTEADLGLQNEDHIPMQKQYLTLHRRQEYCPCLLQLWHFKFSCSTTWQDAWCSNWSS